MQNVDRRPLVTIMIPTFNQSQVLHKAIGSALAQDYENIEVVVADDASQEDTASVVESFADPRVRYFRNRTNIGRVANYRRTLYEYARGDYALNLDGDDFLLYSGFVRECVSTILDTPGCALVFGDFLQLQDGDEPGFPANNLGELRTEVMDGNEFLLSMPGNKSSLQHLTCLYDRKLAMTIGFYEADIISSDYDSLFRFIVNRRISHVNRTGGVWVKHAGNFSSERNIRAWVDNLDLYTSVFSFAWSEMRPRRSADLVCWLIRNYSRYVRRITVRAIRTGSLDVLLPVLKGTWRKGVGLFVVSVLHPFFIIATVSACIDLFRLKVQKRPQ
ncbi:MAG TPA: hypothetical protein DIC34_15295 [Treponema sp.]|nr:MAG: hypothetical protein A2001_18135 [Treponema sp. GWC1_61_84]OHE70149.1 MAG: hypothetical protein A2413_02625 [Treponema sp. RIFOXYC1_FULL_61_9]HCM27881.1 hypothetical protein [Treponema sp.]